MNNILEDFEINILEREWLKGQSYISDIELIKIFPEAREFIREKAKEKLKRFDSLKPIIEDSLREIKDSTQDWFTKWFRKEIIKAFFGNEYNRIFKELKKMVLLLRKEELLDEGRLSQSDIDRAGEHSIEDILGKSKRNFYLCPFHNEKTPSFHIYGENKSKFHCFGCQKKGDAIDIVMKLRGLNFPQAVKFLNR